MLRNYLNQYVKEFYTRSVFLILTFISCIIIIINFIEFINNYLFFFSELQINETEYFYYNNLNYNNTIITNINYEYDWYLDYNIYFSKFGKSNVLVNIYIFNMFLFMFPYILYEIYLYVLPALYEYEKNSFKSWCFYNIASTAFFIYFVEENNIFNSFFYWNEDSFIYLDNEVLDLFIDMNERYTTSFSNIIIHFFVVLYFYNYEYIYNINIIYTIRYIICSFIAVLFISILCNISIINSFILIFIYLIYIEIVFVITYWNTYYQLLKN